MFMNNFEVGNPLSYFRVECALFIIRSGLTEGSCSLFFLLSFLSSFYHFFKSLGHVKVIMFVDDFLKNSLSSLIFLFLNSLK